MQNTQHPDDAAVDALATAMKAKLAKQRAKGYGGWDDKVQCSQQFLSALLRRHVDKGDPVDVANFCAFLLARGEGITAQGAPLPLLLRDIARDLGITVPQACIALKPLGNYSTNSAVTAEMARMLRDHFPAPAHPAEGVPAPMPVPYPHHCTARTADGFCEECEGHAQAMAEWNAERAAIAATHPTQQGMDARATRYEVKGLTVECRGNGKWAVVDGYNVLNRYGEWKFEPSPSSRTDEWLALCRFDSAQEAIAAAKAKQGGAA